MPGDNQSISEGLRWLSELAIRIGRYSLVPILVFSLTIAVFELRQDGQFWWIILRTGIAIAACSIFVISAGVISAIMFPPGRIPILAEEVTDLISTNTAEGVMSLFPSNMFTALFSEGIYLLPLCVFAFFAGMGLSYDRNFTKPVISLVDSLSRVFYHVGVFFSEILGLVLIILSAYWTMRYHQVLRTEMYRDLIVLLGVLSAILGLGIFPALLYILRPPVNPWVILYGSISQAIAAFFSGDINFTLPLIFRHNKENLGVRRRSNALTVTLFTAFGRSGSAMVAAISFMVIINSYSSLGISSDNIIAIGWQAFLISFMLAGAPGSGAYTALALLCLSYGQGFEAGYLILRPIAFYLVAVGTFLDVMISTFASFVISRISGLQEDRRIRQFI